MRYLRKNTAVRIAVGPFFDFEDGVTPEIAMTVTNLWLTLTVEDDDGSAVNLIIDVAPTASGGDNDMVHISSDAGGMYDLELTAGNTNYNGRVILTVHDPDVCTPAFHEFMIMPQQVYDSMFAGTDTLEVDLKQILGTTITETAGLIAAGFKKFFNIAAPSATLNDVTSIKNKTALLPSGIAKNTALANFEFLMVQNNDHITPKTGLTVTATRSIDGGAFGACANAVSELSHGIYVVNFAASDMNGNVVTFKFSGAGADTRYITITTDT